MRGKLNELGDCCSDKLRGFCGEITPDKRLIIILIMLLIGTIVNLYFTFYAIYNIGHKDAEKEFIEVQHIKQLEIEKLHNHLNEEIDE